MLLGHGHVVACSTNYFHGGAEESLGTRLDAYTPLLSENEKNLEHLFLNVGPKPFLLLGHGHVVACSTNCYHGGAEESLGTWLDAYTPLVGENERNLEQLSRTPVSQRGTQTILCY